LQRSSRTTGRPGGLAKSNNSEVIASIIIQDRRMHKMNVFACQTGSKKVLANDIACITVTSGRLLRNVYVDTLI
jgi:hypothetical protein